MTDGPIITSSTRNVDDYEPPAIADLGTLVELTAASTLFFGHPDAAHHDLGMSGGTTPTPPTTPGVTPTTPGITPTTPGVTPTPAGIAPTPVPAPVTTTALGHHVGTVTTHGGGTQHSGGSTHPGGAGTHHAVGSRPAGSSGGSEPTSPSASPGASPTGAGRGSSGSGPAPSGVQFVSDSGPVPASGSTGALAFTGYAAGAVSTIGGLLSAAGVLLRRRLRRD